MKVLRRFLSTSSFQFQAYVIVTFELLGKFSPFCRSCQRVNGFAAQKCSNIYSALENRVAVGDTELSDPLMDMIKKKHEEKGSQSFGDLGDLNIRWRLLCERTAADETRILLSNVVAIFHVTRVFFYYFTTLISP